MGQHHASSALGKFLSALPLCIATNRKGKTLATVQNTEVRMQNAGGVRLGTEPSDLALAKESTKVESLEGRGTACSKAYPSALLCVSR